MGNSWSTFDYDDGAKEKSGKLSATAGAAAGSSVANSVFARDKNMYNLDQTLIPPRELICATQTKFCLPEPAKFRLRQNTTSWSGGDFKVICMATDKTFFKCKGRAFDLRSKRSLQDDSGVHVLNIKNKLWTLTDQYDVFIGNHTNQKTFKIKAKPNFFKSKLTTEFTDKVSGQPKRIVFKGNTGGDITLIFLGEPKQGGIPIGRLYRPLSARYFFCGAVDYYLEVTAGVDIALMVIMCMALDKHERL